LGEKYEKGREQSKRSNVKEKGEKETEKETLKFKRVK
jgi:hypothetical protein